MHRCWSSRGIREPVDAVRGVGSSAQRLSSLALLWERAGRAIARRAGSHKGSFELRCPLWDRTSRRLSAQAVRVTLRNRGWGSSTSP